MGETVALAHEVVGSGPPLVLIAGTGYPGATWRLPELMDALTPHHTVITFDHRGTGASPRTPGLYSTRLFAADCAALLRRLDLGPAIVLGHSMGGRVTQWILLDHPELVSGAILAASGPGQIDPAVPVMRGIPLANAVALIEKGYQKTLADQIRANFFTPEFDASNPQRVQWLVDAFWEHRAPIEDYLKHVIARQQHQTTELLSQIQTPCLVLVGDRDTHRGGTGSHLEQSQFLAEHLPHAELKILPGVMHGYFWEKPQETAQAILEWTARIGPPAA